MRSGGGRPIALVLCAWAAACAGRAEPPQPPSSTIEALARDRAAGLFAQGRLTEAGAALAPLVARDDARPRDLVRAWNVELARGGGPRAEDLGRRARLAAPREPAVLWNLYRQELAAGRFEAALEQARAFHAEAPDDYPGELALAELLTHQGRLGEAEHHFRELLARGHAVGGDWLVAALAGYAELLRRTGRAEQALGYEEELERLRVAGIRAPSSVRRERGSYGDLSPSPPGPSSDPSALEALLAPLQVSPAERLVPTAESTPEGVQGLVAVVLEDPAWEGEAYVEARAPRQELLVFGPQGVRLARLEAGLLRTVEGIVEQPTHFVTALDLRARTEPPGRASASELLVATDDGLHLYGLSEGSWQRLSGRPLVPARFPVRDVAALDLDGDGDLDLFAVGPEGLCVLRNDAVGHELAGFFETTVETGLRSAGDYAWCAGEDLDGDGDTDLLAGGGASGTFVGLNLGAGRFRDGSAELPEELRAAPAPRFFDLDPDGIPDALVGGPRLRLFANDGSARWHPRLVGRDGPQGPLPPLVCDPFAEGRPWVLWPAGREGLLSTRAGGPTEAPVPLHDGALMAPTLLALLDLDADGTPELVESDGRSLRALRVLPRGNGVRLSLRGEADNPRGVGAQVEVRCGPLYRRFWSDGTPIDLGVGNARTLDVVRIRWPDGTLQTELDLAAPGAWRIRQRPAPAGS